MVFPEAKPQHDEPGCTIHVGIHYTVPVLVTTVFLKISPRVRNCTCRLRCENLH